jgi:hypothetical protein
MSTVPMLYKLSFQAAYTFAATANNKAVLSHDTIILSFLNKKMYNINVLLIILYIINDINK